MRDKLLKHYGFNTLRITNEEVLCDIENTLSRIRFALETQRKLKALAPYGERVGLGAIGHLAAFSFHETKNITAGGEGGLLVVNDERFVRRAEILWEKGTNRAEFFRGAVNKYGWVDMGSSFLPAEINAAFLWAQLENLDKIQKKRKQLWNKYHELLKPLAEKGCFTLPDLPDYATNNAHMFYLVCNSLEERTALIRYLRERDIQAVFHYLSLHSSQYYKDRHDGRELPECDRYMDTLLRLPMFYDLKTEDVEHICKTIKAFYDNL
ncbi:MAG: DegT/DnrJ/EryC1/StrS family aminotransferase [Paludibacteraceae bacterium]|nr:DegT/DnrJ/EryC1/StrS family aminotransferase [Paludibacteraceae bacterium]